MIAKVKYNASIAKALSYGEDLKKGGEVIAHNLVSLDKPPNEKAAEWEDLSNNYRHKVVDIIVAFSRKDTKKLRDAIPDMEERKQYEKEILLDFIKAMEQKGNNITDCPFIAYRHGNTQSEHLHLYVLITTAEGKRMNTDFIGKNATRAAAKVSIDRRMEGAKRAMDNEYRWQLKSGERKKVRHHERTTDTKKIRQRMDRNEYIKAAEKRKTKYAYIVREAMKSQTMEGFLAKLRDDDVEFFINDKNEFAIRFMDDEFGPKMRDYTFEKLGITEAVPSYLRAKRDEKVKATAKAEYVQKGKTAVKRTGNSRDRARTNSSVVRTGGAAHLVKRALTQQQGSGDENREYEVGNQEGYEASIEKENRGMSMG